MTMLEIDNLSAGYGGRPVITQISACFGGGQVVSVIGPNGSGKSTLFKAVMGLCRVSAGVVRLDGKTAAETGERLFAQKVSYLPQIRSAGALTAGRMVLHGRFPWLSCPRHYRKEDYQRCDSAMERLGISKLRDVQMDALSGGERQKVYLAMALAGDTEYFLFDEPATYLDVRHQVELAALMQELGRQGKTVTAVLHDINSALQISDRIVVMCRGRIVAEGAPEEIYESGVLQEVFGVKVRRLVDGDGKAYYIASGL